MTTTIIKSSLLSLTLITIFIFFLIKTPITNTQQTSAPQIIIIPKRSLIDSATIGTTNPRSCNSIYETPFRDRCRFSKSHCHGDSDGIFNYFSLHFCVFGEKLYLSLPFLFLVLLLQFYILVKTAQDRFSVVVTKLYAHLKLTPSIGAVTLLALGNGAPDVFASVAAVRGGHARTGFGAILSAGTFVSALVVGFVAIYAAPFNVNPNTFVRDVLFYLIAALSLFYVYLSAEIYLWQAVRFVGFYVFFVGFVFWMDFGMEDHGKGKNAVPEDEARKGLMADKAVDCEMGEITRRVEGEKAGFGIHYAFKQVSKLWEVPVSKLVNLTIPETQPSEWSRIYLSANIAVCPLALLYSCSSFMPLTHPIAFLLPNTHVPLWFVIVLASSSLALLHFVLEKEPPKTERIPVILVAFVMSVFWISTVAGDLLNCLAAIGALLELPPAILGLTVLAWGNSIGDLVADVAVAKAGQPALAMAGCFAGPMFNMLIGLGTALVIQTANVYPEAYELQYHTGIVIAFVFLLLSLMGSLLIVTWCRFRVPKFWGYFLVGLYAVFTGVSLLIAKFSG